MLAAVWARSQACLSRWFGVYCLTLGLFGLGREYLRIRLPSRFVDSAPTWRKRRIFVGIGFLVFGIALLLVSQA